MPKILKAQNFAVVKLLTNWGCMGSPALKMEAASQNIQPSIPFLKNH